MRGIFLEPERCPIVWSTPTMVRVTPLLHELFDYLTTGKLSGEQRQRVEAVVFDALEPVSTIPIGARMPTDPRARAVAERIAADPSGNAVLADVATDVGLSSRTLARAFVAETGITFGQWRTQVRLASSLPLLAANMPLARIAGRVGYATPSAYVAAFHREVGISPGRYFAD